MTATAFKIERGHDIPASSIGRPCVYPFGQMAVGDSFFFQGDIHRLRPAATWFGKRNARQFTTRKVPGGYRIWRIA